jgi:hypothetical protein
MALPRVEEPGDHGGVLVARATEAGADDHQVRGVEAFEPAQSGLVVRIDVVVGPGEDDRAVEAVPLGEDLREHRRGLLPPILLVTGDDDDVPTATGAVLSLQDKGVGGGQGGGEEQGEQQEGD